VPPDWNEFALRYRYRDTYYHIAVRRTELEGDEELDTLSVISMGSRNKATTFFLPTIGRNTGSR